MRLATGRRRPVPCRDLDPGRRGGLPDVVRRAGRRQRSTARPRRSGRAARQRQRRVGARCRRGHSRLGERPGRRVAAVLLDGRRRGANRRRAGAGTIDRRRSHRATRCSTPARPGHRPTATTCCAVATRWVCASSTMIPRRSSPRCGERLPGRVFNVCDTVDPELVKTTRQATGYESNAAAGIALATAIIAGFLVAQAVARQSRRESDDRDALVALGAARRDLAAAASLRWSIAAAVAVVVSAAAVVGASALGPIGIGRRGPWERGLSVDWVVLAVGLPAVVLLVIAAGVIPTVRRASARALGGRRVRARAAADRGRRDDGAPRCAPGRRRAHPVGGRRHRRRGRRCSSRSPPGPSRSGT